ncbi:phage tail protein [Xenorhabdus mauleonii]|uniref:Phage tail assembly chaperone protein, E, or 41 or 14 n=1 Tax=Xenorhabdus mauleonii TaxID=351675 RepID=A0A1I3YD43_9GAMM|nr:phage tail assembly protein [Xenorhabdus mauleonii]PHM35626.1 phage tail protein [Xenorhabdus mauleonii]SFK29191.1 Phage tail assembly chaperone protein, E, or 41 or 14 [Xenorhabdus mauleonii]
MTEKNAVTQTDATTVTLPEHTVVTLEEPIARGATTIQDVTVRKPNSGALRGVRLQALMEMDVDSIMLILPRITAPALTKNDLLLLAPGDLINLSVEVVNFLLPKSVKSDFQNN